MTDLAGAPAVNEEPRKKLKIGERGADGRVYTGYAIVGKKVLFSSVSSIKKYDPHYDGCPRRWFYIFREGKKEDKTAAQTGGSNYGKQLEDYLKTGIDKMQPVLMPVKHLFPKPGPDLEVEVDLAVDLGKAIALRRLLVGLSPSLEAFSDKVQADMRTFLSTTPDRSAMEAELQRCAGLVLAGVPQTGAADVRHRRGEYIDTVGQLRREDPGMQVVSIDDLKTTKRINDHITRNKTVLPGWALTAEEVVVDTQMVGYGVHSVHRHPGTTHLRLAHNYAQTANGFAGVRRMGLVTVEHVLRRWDERDAPVMREMMDVAAEDDAQKVPINTKACKAFGRECPHLSYCQPTRTLGDVFDFNTDHGESSMSTGNGLFDSITSGSNGVSQNATPPSIPEGLGLFGSQATVAATPPPIPSPLPATVMSDAERERQIAEAKDRLRNPPHPLLGLEEHGYTVGQSCNGHGYYQSTKGDRSGFLPTEPGHVCQVCAKAPSVPSAGAVNPMDSPKFDVVAAQTPLPPEEIAKIEDSEIRGRAEAIAKAAQERAALQATANGAVEKKTSGYCSASGTTVVLTDKQKVSRKLKCPGEHCDKEHKIKDKDFTQDLSSAVIPKHRLRGAEPIAKPTIPPPAAAPVPPVISAAAVAPAIPPSIPAAAPVLPPVLPTLPIAEPPALPGEMTSMVEQMFGEVVNSAGVVVGKSVEEQKPSLPPPVAPPVDATPPEVPMPKPVAPMNCLTVVKHIVQGVALNLETKESAFDRIAAVLGK